MDGTLVEIVLVVGDERAAFRVGGGEIEQVDSIKRDTLRLEFVVEIGGFEGCVICKGENAVES